MKKKLLALPVALTLALAACGDEEADTASGPASIIPADMPLYIEATVRPEGEQAENLDAFVAELGELPLIGAVGDPGDLLIQQLESQAASAGVDFTYADDVEPWLGEKAGFGISEDDSGETRFVVAVETTDEDGAREAIDNLLAEDSVQYEEGEYEGASYLSSPGDEYRLGVFSGHVVLAPPADFEAAVDASDGDSLGDSEKMSESFARLDEDGLASMFIDLEQFGAIVSAEDPDLAQAQEIVPELFESGIAIGMGLSASDQVYLDYSTPLLEGQPEAGASALLETLPGDAIGAAAIEEIGAFGEPIADLFERAQEAGADLEDFPAEGLEAAFEDETGVPFDDATAAMGDAGFWVRGDVPDGLEVGAEIQVSDTDVAADLIDAIEQEVESEGGAKLGPPVGGSDVGFSAIESGSGGKLGVVEPCTSVGDVAECLPTEAAGADLPFTNVELDGDVIRLGFFKDEAAAQASDPESGGDFGETDTFATGQEAVGGDFELLGAFDLAPVLDQVVPGPSVQDALAGPEELIAPFLAEKLGVVAMGVRYEDGAAVQRYVLKLAE